MIQAKTVGLGVAMVFLVGGTGSVQAQGVTAALTEAPAKVNLVPAQVFSPTGFDNNDNSQIVLTGELPSTCYKVGPVSTQIDTAKKRIVIRNEVYLYASAWCAQILVPYKRVVDLGIVPEGRYELVALNDRSKQVRVGALRVGRAKSTNADELLYAPVTGVQVDSNIPAKSATVTLRGIFPNRCMSLAEVRVVRNDPRVVEVLPVAKLGSEAECVAGVNDKREFSAAVDVTGLSDGQTLIHVRALNGESHNEVIEL